MLRQSFQNLGETLGMGKRLRLDEGLGRHATLRLGGDALVWAEVETVGLKGTAVGGARISPLHGNFFINEEGASSHDFLSLKLLARVKVRGQFGVELRPEVRFVGFDGWSRMLEIEHRMEVGA